jgi:large-conductance mechanosensitive channel
MDIANTISFREKLGKFIIDNGIAATAAGVSIAVSTKELITSFVGDIFIPLIYLLLIRINPTAVKVLPENLKINGIGFVEHFISWIFVIIIAFLLIQYFFSNILGVSEEKKSDDTKKKDEGFGTLY